MKINYTNDIYTVVSQINTTPVKTKKSTGLLSPNMSKIKKDGVKKQPVYKIAKFTNAIKNIRMESRNVRNKTT